MTYLHVIAGSAARPVLPVVRKIAMSDLKDALVAQQVPPQDLGTPQDPITARGDMRTEVLTCAMPPDFAVNVICYGYGGD